MSTEEQIRLVKKAVKGNPDAYGALIAEHQEYLEEISVEKIEIDLSDI